jgi:PAS domain-containing protein
MRRVLHANCFPPAHTHADALLSDEALVLAAAPSNQRVLSAEEGMDAELAHRTSVAMSRAALDWFRIDLEDPSIVAGVSAGDLAVSEAMARILMPAARGVLAMTAALDRGLEPTTLVSVVPAGGGRYARLETLAADAAVATAELRLGGSLAVERIVSEDPRNAWLRDKYAGVRDGDQLALTGADRRLARSIALGAVNAPARRRRRPALLVLEYNPTHAFARRYGRRRHRRWRLVCWPAHPRDLLAVAQTGDQAILLRTPDLATLPPSGAGQRLRARAEELGGRTLRVAGVDLWSIVRDPLLALAERYGRYAAALAAPLARELERRAVAAVLVPFDSAPNARLIVRVSQAMGIPTFVINDGYKADDIQQEGMAADIALAWSEAIRDGYFSRRPNGAHVTGNPRAERLTHITPRRRVLRRVLVGGHAFSPIDLNCRRSDAERFLDEVLDGIAAARAHVSAEVVVKLHGSDSPGYHRESLARHPGLEIDLQTDGDVIALFGDCDVYVTTYSTSLIEAAAVGLPVVYYRINAQRLGRPFSDDEFLARRSVSTPAQLASLLADRDALAVPPPGDWVERYLGPTERAVERIIAAVEEQVVRPRPGSRRRLRRADRST